MTTPTTHYRACNLCEAMCGLEIRHQGNQILSIRGDKQDPFSKGFICPKAVALQDIYHDPDRLRTPQLRKGATWESISWEKAFDLVEAGLKKVRKTYGQDAIGIYQGNPNVHNLGAMLFAPFFIRALRSKNRFSATSVDQLPHHLAAQEMLGHYLTIPIPDIDRTQFLLMLGANPMASNGSLMSAPGMPRRLKAIQDRGGKFVVIDPRRSETAEKADQHLFIRPGTDVFLLAGLVQQLFAQSLIDLQQLPAWAKDADQVESLFRRFTPEEVSALTGIPADEVSALATGFATASSAVCYGRMGVSTQEHGALCHWLINLINILTGNFDRAGGAMLPKPAIDVVKGLSAKGTQHRHGRWHSRVRGLPETGGELPVAALAEEILTPGDGQIKALFCAAGNPVLSTPNGTQLEKALAELEFMVSIDIYRNETNRFADLILPPATGLQIDHYDLVFHNLAVRNTTKYSPALLPKDPHGKYEWEIYKELTRRFQPKGGLKSWFFHQWATPARLLNQALKQGPYDLSLKQLQQHPHGLDLGPLKPALPDRLFTSDKQLHLLPEKMVAGIQALSLAPSSSTEFPLHLIGRRDLRSNNSWMHNAKRLVKGPERCTLLIHPDDAKTHQISEKQLVTLQSRTGTVQAKAEISEEMARGVVSLPHGWGHHRKGTGWQVAEAHAGVSLNDLTDDQRVDAISGNAAFSGVPVRIVPD